MTIFFILVLSYLIGTIPFGLLLSKMAGLGDIRKIGSGNIGATNVLRTGNKTLAALTLFLDGAKGAVAVIIANYFSSNEIAVTAGLIAMIGHCYPVWLKFKGGKGVATTLGVLLAAAPYAGLAACAAWLITAFTTKISSLAALVAVLVASIVTFFAYGQTPGLIATFITALVWWRHKENIKRLRKGAEPKIGEGKKK